MNTNWHERLVELARAQAMAAEVDALTAVRDRLYQASGIASLDIQIDHLKRSAETVHKTLQQDGKDYVNETGETDLHDLIDVRRTRKAVYDDKEALAWCEENAPEFVRVKRSLDKRPFNSAVKDESIEFAGAEMVNEITIAIKAVGHLLEGGDNS